VVCCTGTAAALDCIREDNQKEGTSTQVSRHREVMWKIQAATIMQYRQPHRLPSCARARMWQSPPQQLLGGEPAAGWVWRRGSGHLDELKVRRVLGVPSHESNKPQCQGHGHGVERAQGEERHPLGGAHFHTGDLAKRRRGSIKILDNPLKCWTCLTNISAGLLKK